MQLLIDSMQVYGDLTIDMGKTFNIIVSPANQTIEEIKKDISSNDVNKFKKYIIDEANSLLYETEIVSPEYHFRYFVSIGKEQMMIADGLNADGTPYTEAEIKLMLECAQTIKAN
jgi:ABC-type proline/glycine betaine transport system ATPase subunit